jgi:hypothetical protein
MYKSNDEAELERAEAGDKCLDVDGCLIWLVGLRQVTDTVGTTSAFFFGL